MPFDANWRCGEFQWRSDRTCSFCGSMHPDDLMELLREGKCTITPTDKSYKIYVEPGMRKFYMNHLVSIEHTKEFMQMYENHKMKLEYPGYFYAHIWLPALKT